MLHIFIYVLLLSGKQTGEAWEHWTESAFTSFFLELVSTQEKSIYHTVSQFGIVWVQVFK